MRAAALVAAVLARLLGSPAAPAAERPDIVFLLADDLRPDCLSGLGHPVVITPNLDRLVREGTAFTRAVAAYPICHVSRAEILTGATAFRCGVPWRGNRIDPRLKTWAATFRDAGYRTCYAGKWDSDGRPTDRGYAETRRLYTAGGAEGRPLTFPRDAGGRPATGYAGWTFKTPAGAPEPDLGVGLTPDTSRLIADGAIDFIRTAAGPYFLHISFTAPHDPRLLPPGSGRRYDPSNIPLPPSFRQAHGFDHGNLTGRDERLLAAPRDPAEVRRELAVYYAVVSHLDEQVGRILRTLEEVGRLDNTVVVFASDQGLALGSHGLVGKQNLYEHTFGVPLLVRGPGVPRGARRAAACYLRDLFPTTCELAGVPVPDTVEGRSLVPVLRGTADAVYPAVFGYFADTQRCVRDGRWKLIRYPKAGVTQLFDLATDADETRNLAGDPAHPAKVGELLDTLQREQARWGDDLPLFPGERKP
jgi:arylsulfatase A-like enzyme